MPKGGYELAEKEPYLRRREERIGGTLVIKEKEKESRDTEAVKSSSVEPIVCVVSAEAQTRPRD